MAANEHTDYELVVAADGSIPADQLVHLGVAPGSHLRVVQSGPAGSTGSFAGSLPHFPDLSWEDFERGSELAGAMSLTRESRRRLPRRRLALAAF